MTKAEENGLEERVERVFVALYRLSEGDLIAMRAAWDAGDANARELAWSKVKAKLRGDPRAELLENARGRLATWVNEAYVSWRGGSLGAAVVIPAGIDLGDLRRSVQPAVLDAVAAMLVADVLDDLERDELLGPLRSVTDGSGR